MIGCTSFRKMMNDYLENKLSYEDRIKMDAHRNTCLGCRSLINEEIEFDDIFTSSLSEKNINFKSVREEILNSIDTNKYSSRLSRRVYYNMKKNYALYLIRVALIILIFTAGFYGIRLNREGINPANTNKYPDKIIEKKYLGSPSEIAYYRDGERRIVSKESPEFSQILEMSEKMIKSPLETYKLEVSQDEIIKRIQDSELSLEFIYDAPQTGIYETYNTAGNSKLPLTPNKTPYNKLLISLASLNGEYSGLIAIGDNKSYFSMPIGVKYAYSDFKEFVIKLSNHGNELISPSQELINIYKEYSLKEDDNLLLGLDPIDVCRLYFYAEEKLDYDTMYALLNKEKPNGVPEYSEYIRDIENNSIIMENSKKFINTLKEQTSSIELIPVSEEETIINFKFKSADIMGGETFFRMEKSSKGVWKVGWLAIQ